MKVGVSSSAFAAVRGSTSKYQYDYYETLSRVSLSLSLLYSLYTL